MTQESDDDAQGVTEPELRFGPFRLEAAKRLWQGNQLIDLRPRSLALLRYFAEQPYWGNDPEGNDKML